MSQVLLVEDDAGVAELLALALRSLGHTVTTAVDGLAGLAAAAGNRFDVMLLVLIAPQLRRLVGLTEDLLEISRMDAGRAHVERSRIDLMDLVNEVIDDCGAPSDVSLVGCFPLEVSTDPARLRVIVRNLVANALQHGAAPVTIRAEANEASVTVSVTDEGTGVPTALRERVFDRFVRGDEARHGSSSGLGLAIAAENARLLGGTLTLDADGRTFLLTLPA